MVKANLYYDSRRLNKNGEGQVRVRITQHRNTAMFSLGISVRPYQWKDGVIVKHQDADFLNSILSIKKGQIEKAILDLSVRGIFVGKTVKQVAAQIQEYINPDTAVKQADANKSAHELSFCYLFNKVILAKDNAGTRGLYHDTLQKVHLFLAYKGLEPSTFSINDINKTWLESFERFCLKTERQNTAARHLRDIRAVINYAIDEGITANYPFRNYTIKQAETLDKSFSSEELRELFNHTCYPGFEQEAVDIFKLMFCLIGINCVDIANAKLINKGRLEYIRAKTKKPYSIKLEPEALDIINKYKGTNNVLNILERIPNYKTYFNRLAKTLRKVGLIRISGKKSIGKAILPDVCTGSARTSWATIAQEELDIPRDVISAALGHHIVDVTSTYLRTNWRKKVDAANRAVLDWVLYGKR